MKIFETASFHIVKPCNMACKFCYATFDDMPRIPQLPIDQVREVLFRLKHAGVEKITFAGGEPTMYRHLSEAIDYAKNIGLVTSIITNASYLTDHWLEAHVDILDWVGISVDSLNSTTNKDIGRIIGGLSPNGKFYREMVDRISGFGYKIKINTVVNRFNENEDMQEFIDYANPARWKIFDTLRVEGQNDKQFDAIKSSPGAFGAFVARHNHPSMVVENNEAMTGSYLLIDPQGRLFENSAGRHTYSSPLQHNDIEKCLSEINLNRERFIERGGIYSW